MAPLLSRLAFLVTFAVLIAHSYGQGTSNSTLGTGTGSAQPMPAQLSGSGSTLLSKLIWKLLSILEARTRPSLHLVYRAIGSGGGVSELGVSGSALGASAVRNQFAASDVPLTAAQNPMTASGPSFLHFPVAVGAVGIYVNIPVGLSGDTLNVSACLLNDIFSGRCATWDCPAILDLNPNFLPTPGVTIRIGVRADRSGTSTVISSWLRGPTGACAQAEGPPSTHPFGTGEALFRGGGYFYDAAAVTPGAAGVPSNVNLGAGTSGLLDFLLTTPWSLIYSDSGQATSAEAAILNPSGQFLRSTDSAAATIGDLPLPDGSSAAGAPRSNAAWPAVSIFDSATPGTFPLVTLAYVIVPAAFQQGPAGGGFDVETVAMLMAFLQFLYYPEVTHGYNASCGYTSSGLLNLVPGPKGSPLPAFSCGGYSPAGMLSGFRFAHLPEAWMTTVLQALAAAAATGTLSFTPGGAAGAGIQLFNASSFGASAAAVPLWTFEPTERSLAVRAADPGGSAQRVISYNAMSTADFERTRNADTIRAMAAKITTLQGGVFGTTSSALGDRSVVFRLSGSGASLPSKLIWRACDLMMHRAHLPVLLSYRAIGSGAGLSEFAGPNNGFAPWTHFGASDSVLPSTCAAPGGAPCVSHGALRARFGDQAVLTLPIAVGMVGVFHTVPAASAPPGARLNLTANVVCQIYSGSITTWDHASIKVLNPELRAVPANQPITVVVRADSSGSTRVFSSWMAATCGRLFHAAPGSVVQWPAGVNAVARMGSSGVTSFMSPLPRTALGQETAFSNPWAIAYVDSGFGKDAGLVEAALELRAGTGVFAASTALGVAGLLAPAGGYPASSFADWATNDPQPRLFNQWQGGSAPPVFPIICFSYVFLRGDLSRLGEAGRLAVALVRFLLSADAGTPAGSAPESPASPLKFYGDFLMAQPPQALVAQALADLRLLQFSPAAPEDWAFERRARAAAAGHPPTSPASQRAHGQRGRRLLLRSVGTAPFHAPTARTGSRSFFASPGSAASGHAPFSGSVDRVFSVWRSDYADYRWTANAQGIISETQETAQQMQRLAASVGAALELQGTIQGLRAQVAQLQAEVVQANEVGGATTLGAPSDDSAGARGVAVAAIVLSAVSMLVASVGFAAAWHVFSAQRRAATESAAAAAGGGAGGTLNPLEQGGKGSQNHCLLFW